MLATIRNDTWNVLKMQHITPNLKRWDYSDIPGGGHKNIKRTRPHGWRWPPPSKSPQPPATCHVADYDLNIKNWALQNKIYERTAPVVPVVMGSDPHIFQQTLHYTVDLGTRLLLAETKQHVVFFKQSAVGKPTRHHRDMPAIFRVNV